MKRRLQKELRGWLERERAASSGSGTAESAERSLRRVFERLPLDRPTSGFADRVLAQAGVALRRRTGLPAWMPPRLFTALTAVFLVMAGLMVIFLPATLGTLVAGLDGRDLRGRFVGWLASLCHQAVDTLAAWEAVTGVGATLADILLSPTWGAVLALSLVVSGCAMRALHELLVPAHGA